MNKKKFICLIAAVFIALPALSRAENLKPVKLPQPRKDGGRPLMEVLGDRASSREYSSRPLPLQVLSDMLWAAFGINRPESGKRTAPSAVNWQEIDIYVSMKSGLFLYVPAGHRLEPVLEEDIRAATGSQEFCADAPVNLVFVADFSRMGGAGDEQKIFYSAADTGYISQNVYLYCASEGLATVVRGMVDKEALAEKMKLKPDQRVILAQTVGYPKEK